MDNENVVIEENSLPVATSKGGIVKPLVSPDEAVKAWNEYQRLKAKIIEPSDVQKIQGREFLKKSYWRKLEKFFGLSLECVSESSVDMSVVIRTEGGRKIIEYYPKDSVPQEYLSDENVTIKTTTVFSARYRATAPNGQYCEGDGYCDIWEKGYANSYHNARATAHTRAKNRAISDLVGGGEVSAEEITEDYHDETDSTTIRKSKPTPKKKASNEDIDDKDKEIQGKLGNLLLDISDGDIVLSKQLLYYYSSFEDKNGAIVTGKKQLKELTGKWLASTYGKVKKAHEEWEADKDKYWEKMTRVLENFEELIEHAG